MWVNREKKTTDLAMEKQYRLMSAAMALYLFIMHLTLYKRATSALQAAGKKYPNPLATAYTHMATNPKFTQTLRQKLRICVEANPLRGVLCYDPPPFFSSPSTVTIMPAAPAQAPALVPVPAPAHAVMPIACRAPARTPTHYVYPSLPEALIPVRTIPPSHPTTSPTAQLQGEPNIMDINDKSPVPSCQGDEMGSAATSQVHPIPRPVFPRLDTRNDTLS